MKRGMTPPSYHLHTLSMLARRIAKLIFVPFALPIVLIVRAITPWRTVRFGVLRSARIGHFAVNTELYLCERDAGIGASSRRVVDYWVYSDSICNRQLARMWNRRLAVDRTGFVAAVMALNRRFPNWQAHEIPDGHGRDIHNLFEKCPPHLRFSPEEERIGRKRLRELGIPRGAPFVCLMVRDSAYLTHIAPKRDFSYHGYRDSDITNYVLAARELVKLGYYVVRMGAVVERPIEVNDSKIIDYAANGMRTEFMDVYLGATCAFCISSGTGLDCVPHVFRRPICYVNFGPVEFIPTYVKHSLTISKGHWLRAEQRFMSFREIFESGAGVFLHAEKYESAGIELVENTPEEVAAVVLEMAHRVRGTWNDTEQDEALQRRFWEIFPRRNHGSMPLHGAIRGRIGAQFLRCNQAWLA